ncbi:MAG: hypothetical protein QOH96_2247 [Blastocatellia bacterium]|jgi:hypothetical protein|nr:hypothetical protein [Blastocatellia bacterium]
MRADDTVPLLSPGNWSLVARGTFQAAVRRILVFNCMWLFAEEDVYHATGGPRLPVTNEIMRKIIAMTKST